MSTRRHLAASIPPRGNRRAPWTRPPLATLLVCRTILASRIGRAWTLLPVGTSPRASHHLLFLRPDQGMLHHGTRTPTTRNMLIPAHEGIPTTKMPLFTTATSTDDHARRFLASIPPAVRSPARPIDHCSRQYGFAHSRRPPRARRREKPAQPGVSRRPPYPTYSRDRTATRHPSNSR
jgi:hypothetical protein